MSKLICDICGTSYSDDIEKCPTCGYSRAFEELTPYEKRTPAAREKVRGGRFSKKNVRRRLEQREKADRQVQETALELGGELGAAVASVLAAQEQTIPASREQSPVNTAEQMEAPLFADADVHVVKEEVAEIPEEPAAVEEPIVLVLPEEEPAAEAVAEIPEEPAAVEEPIVLVLPEEEPAAEAVEEFPEEPAAVEEPIVLVLPEEEPAAEEVAEIPEEPAAVEEPIVLVLPEEESAAEAVEEFPEEPAAVEEPIVMSLPEEEPAAEAVEELPEEPAAAEEPVVMVLPETETTAVPETEPKAEEEEKKKKGGCLLHVLLYTSLAVFLAAAVYLLVSYGIPYLKTVDWPTRPAAETTVPTEAPTPAPTEEPTQAPTEASTDPPTEAPTEAPTDPPTEVPTDPPTEAPTETPTEPLLDVKLELNYYDLTFGAANQGTQLEAKTIPNEDITWISDDPAVVTISETGKIISVGGGRTTVRAIYGSQEVTVKINCAF